jgi:hypothetical protein
VAVIDEHDEIRAVAAGLGAIAVGYLESEVVVLGVGDDPGMFFRDAAEFGFPVAVEHYPVDVVLRRRAVGFPAEFLGGVESDVGGGACGIVGIEQGLDRE